MSLEFFKHEKSERLKYSLPFNDTKKAKGLRHFLRRVNFGQGKSFKEFLKFLFFRKTMRFYTEEMF